MSFRPPPLEAEPRGGVVGLETTFPVLESAHLDPVVGGLFRRGRRRVEELPLATSGSVLVFQVDERFALAPVGRSWLSSEIVARATMVHVVTLRSRELAVVTPLPAGTGDQ